VESFKRRRESRCRSGADCSLVQGSEECFFTSCGGRSREPLNTFCESHMECLSLEIASSIPLLTQIGSFCSVNEVPVSMALSVIEPWILLFHTRCQRGDHVHCSHPLSLVFPTPSNEMRSRCPEWTSRGHDSITSPTNERTVGDFERHVPSSAMSPEPQACGKSWQFLLAAVGRLRLFSRRME
jgi:hypothetical protein